MSVVLSHSVCGTLLWQPSPVFLPGESHGQRSLAGCSPWGLKELEHNWVTNTRKGNGTPLQCSCLEDTMDGGAWWASVHRVAKSQTRLSDFTFTFYFHALEKEMATHTSVLAWRIPGTGEPSGLPSMGLHRVGHDWSDLAAAAAAAVIKYNARKKRFNANLTQRQKNYLTH